MYEWLGKILAVLVAGCVLAVFVINLIGVIVQAVTSILWALVTGIGVLVAVAAAAAIVGVLFARSYRRAEAARYEAWLESEDLTLQQLRAEYQHLREMIDERRLNPPANPVMDFIGQSRVNRLREMIRLVQRVTLRRYPKAKLQSGADEVGRATAAPGSKGRSGNLPAGPNAEGSLQDRMEKLRLNEAARARELEALTGDRPLEECPPSMQELGAKINRYWDEMNEDIWPKTIQR